MFVLLFVAAIYIKGTPTTPRKWAPILYVYYTMPTVSNTRTLRYIPHNAVQQYERTGWIALKRMHGHHGEYAVLMEKKNADSHTIPAKEFAG
tara:strand:+ start:340 stop:615 length:276 start_codon:yes stop_codon:yes gene_type:complete